MDYLLLSIYACIIITSFSFPSFNYALQVKGGRGQGRQRKRWEDNIREWTDLEFAKSQRAVEKTEKLRKPVVKSSVVPQWSSRLRDRWWWYDDELCTQSVSFSFSLVLCRHEFQTLIKTKFRTHFMYYVYMLKKYREREKK